MTKSLPRAALVLLALWLPARALAEPDSFGLGTGRNGAFTAATGNQVVNTYTQLTAPRLPGDTTLPVTSIAGFATGDLVMVLQSTGIVPVPASGDAGPYDLSVDPVGTWELARLSGTSAGTLSLTAPLIRGFTASVTQVIRVPEYTTVTIPANANLTAQVWNGSTGGVVAFLATGAITNNGQISAGTRGTDAGLFGTGFRGGLFVNFTTSNNAALDGCSELDGPAGPLTNDGGGGVGTIGRLALKGEGVANVAYSTDAGAGGRTVGRGNVVNGAGGGVCHNSGGGGGGHGGAGGKGGRTWDEPNPDGGLAVNRDVGGLGGGVLSYSLLDHLIFGGGGGAGHGNNNVGTGGAAGGGSVFIRAASMTGTGAVHADGMTAGSTTGGFNDAAGGGGAGGSIYLRVQGALACGVSDGGAPAMDGGALTAVGGNGGNVNFNRHGPGGGGGGGRILIQASSYACTPSVLSGVGGTQLDDGGVGVNFGAGPSSPSDPSTVGSVVVPSGGFTVPAVPAVITPANGATVTVKRPPITGTAPANTTVVIYLDGVEIGRTTSNGSGNFSFTPTSDLSEGSHQVAAASELQGVQSAKSPVNTFLVDTVPPSVPVISTPTAGAALATARPTLTGTADPGSSVEIRVDGVLVATVTADAGGNWSYTLSAAQALADGPHTASVLARDAAGNASAPATRSFSTDATAPDTFIVSGPPSATSSTTATFDLDASESGVTYQCSLDGGAFASCSDPAIFNGLSNGSHTLLVRAVDAVGNVDASPASFTWLVDDVPPAAPVVILPANGSTVPASPTPVISGTAEANSTVQVFLDGVLSGTTTADASGNFSYTPPVSLGNGSHTAFARAQDAAGNTSVSSNTNTFTVDGTPPDTAIDSNPPLLSSSSSATFAFSSNEAGASFECRLDGSAFAPCTSNPLTFTGLADGSHTFEVRAKDAAGNLDPSPASFTWTVDTAAPGIPVITAPTEGASVATATPTVTGTAEPNATVEIFIDGALAGTATADASGNFSFLVPMSLAAGAHTATARARDGAGNVGASSAVRNFTVDLTAPDTQIASGPPTQSNSSTASFTFTSNEANVTYECSLDSGAFVPCAASSIFPGLADGSHMLAVRARDAAGNVDPTPAVAVWNVDTAAPPVPVIVAPAALSTTGPLPTITGTAEAGATVEIFIDGVLVGSVTADASGDWTYTLTAGQALMTGLHSVTARAVDAAGNASAQSTARAFIVLGGGPGDGGTTLPDGGTTLPDGGTTLPDGGTTLPDGGTATSDGGTTLPDGGSSTGDGGMVDADGGMVDADGGMVDADGGATLEDGGGSTGDGGEDPLTGNPLEDYRFRGGGCGCGAADPAPAAFWAVLGLIAFIQVRTRRRASGGGRGP